MSFYIPSLFECPKCGRQYESGSFTCKYCEQEKQQKRENILEILENFDNYEISALLELVKEKSAELRKKDLESKIQKLNKELKEMEGD